MDRGSKFKSNIDCGRTDFPGIEMPTKPKDIYSLRYTHFTMPIVKSIQEPQVIIEKLRKELDVQTKNINEQNQLIDDLKTKDDQLMTRLETIEKK